VVDHKCLTPRNNTGIKKRTFPGKPRASSVQNAAEGSPLSSTPQNTQKRRAGDVNPSVTSCNRARITASTSHRVCYRPIDIDRSPDTIASRLFSKSKSSKASETRGSRCHWAAAMRLVKRADWLPRFQDIRTRAKKASSPAFVGKFWGRQLSKCVK
jgi:hypothetical protein